MPGLSRSRIKALIDEGRVAIEAADGSAGETLAQPSYRVKPAQSFVVTIPEPVIAAPKAQSLPLDVIFEDEHLIVINKPAGLVVHPAAGNPDSTLVNALIAHCGDSLSGIGGVRRPGIVHRLDKDTSGLMVVAKNDAAHAGLARQFAEHSLDRAYRALVWGLPQPTAGEISGNIGRNPRNRKKMAVVAKGGKTALTHYRLLERVGEDFSLVECRLATGRTHQIRVHMAHLGHAIVGDPLYGRARGRKRAVSAEARAATDGFARQALHAVELGFEHPAGGKRRKFRVDLAPDIKGLIRTLESN